jgi:hypothetical protein
MTALPLEECKKWLAARGIDHDPYSRSGGSGYCHVTGAFTDLHRAHAFIRNLMAHGLKPSGEVLLEINDWPLYNEDEMAVVQAFRASFGEARDLIDARGHMFGPAELNPCIGLFNLTVMYGWSAYLYVPDPPLTVFNWEGEIFDFWSSQKELIEKAREMCHAHKIPDRPVVA